MSVQGRKDEMELVSRMKLNDNKAGMEGLDSDKINNIIYEASKGSKFYENELKKESQMNKKIQEQNRQVESLQPQELLLGQREADRVLELLEASRDVSHTIVHVDMDAFYAAVEMRDNLSLKHVPMAVGGNSMLSTSNYIARRFGVRAAMPGFIAKKLCPHLVIVDTNFDKYTEVSGQVRDIFKEYDENYSPMSLDEAYLDITLHLQNRLQMDEKQRTFQRIQDDDELCKCDNKTHDLENTGNAETQLATSKPTEEATEEPQPCELCGKNIRKAVITKTFGYSAEETVHEMRFRIHARTGLTASAGIACNTLLAKVGSDMRKPNGQFHLPPTREAVMEFIGKLPIRKVHGIGKVSEKMLQSVGVNTCQELHEKRGLLWHLYSPASFEYFMEVSLGLGSTTVSRDGERKSMSVESTFGEISKPADLFKQCLELSKDLATNLKSEELMGKTVTLKMKTVKFELKTRSQTIRNYTQDADTIYITARDILRSEIQANAPQPLKLRLMGVRMSNLLSEKDSPLNNQTTITGLFQRVNEKTVSQQADGCAARHDRSPKSTPKGKKMYSVCPLCGREITSKLLSVINSHIDACLNKEDSDDRFQNIGNRDISKTETDPQTNASKSEPFVKTVVRIHEKPARWMSESNESDNSDCEDFSKPVAFSVSDIHVVDQSCAMPMEETSRTVRLPPYTGHSSTVDVDVAVFTHDSEITKITEKNLGSPEKAKSVPNICQVSHPVRSSLQGQSIESESDDCVIEACVQPNDGVHSPEAKSEIKMTVTELPKKKKVPTATLR